MVAGRANEQWQHVFGELLGVPDVQCIALAGPSQTVDVLVVLKNMSVY